MTITSSDPQHFIPPGTRARSYVEANPSIPAIYLQLGGGADQLVTLVLDWGHNTKAGALAQLAEWVAAVEALPDDTHAGQGVLPTEPECDGLCVDSSDIGVPGYGIAYAHPGCPLHDTPGRKCECGTPDRCLSPTHDPAPVWRTLTFGDLRAGDVIKSDQDDDPETVERVLAYVRTDQSTHYRNADLVLVRHPRPEVGQ